MEDTIIQIIFWLLLIDAIIANAIGWGCGQKWFNKEHKVFARYFPLTKGWTTMYLVLTLFIGYLIYFF